MGGWEGRRGQGGEGKKVGGWEEGVWEGLRVRGCEEGGWERVRIGSFDGGERERGRDYVAGSGVHRWYADGCGEGEYRIGVNIRLTIRVR